MTDFYLDNTDDDDDGGGGVETEYSHQFKNLIIEQDVMKREREEKIAAVEEPRKKKLRRRRRSSATVLAGEEDDEEEASSSFGETSDVTTDHFSSGWTTEVGGETEVTSSGGDEEKSARSEATSQNLKSDASSVASSSVLPHFSSSSSSSASFSSSSSALSSGDEEANLITGSDLEELIDMEQESYGMQTKKRLLPFISTPVLSDLIGWATMGRPGTGGFAEQLSHQLKNRKNDCQEQQQQQQQPMKNIYQSGSVLERCASKRFEHYYHHLASTSTTEMMEETVVTQTDDPKDDDGKTDIAEVNQDPTCIDGIPNQNLDDDDVEITNTTRSEEMRENDCNFPKSTKKYAVINKNATTTPVSVQASRDSEDEKEGNHSYDTHGEKSFMARLYPELEIVPPLDTLPLINPYPPPRPSLLAFIARRATECLDASSMKRYASGVKYGKRIVRVDGQTSELSDADSLDSLFSSSSSEVDSVSKTGDGIDTNRTVTQKRRRAEEEEEQSQTQRRSYPDEGLYNIYRRTTSTSRLADGLGKQKLPRRGKRVKQTKYFEKWVAMPDPIKWQDKGPFLRGYSKERGPLGLVAGQLDCSALVATGIAVEEILRASFRPLARMHVARCHNIEEQLKRKEEEEEEEGGEEFERANGTKKRRVSSYPNFFSTDNDDENIRIDAFEAWTLSPSDAIMELVRDRSSTNSHSIGGNTHNGIFNLFDETDESPPDWENNSSLPSSEPVSYDKSGHNRTCGGGTWFPNMTKEEQDNSRGIASQLWCHMHKLPFDFVRSNMDLFGLFLRTPPPLQTMRPSWTKWW